MSDVDLTLRYGTSCSYPPVAVQRDSARVKLVSLVCLRDLKMAIRCLGSLLRCCREDLDVLFFEDGTLSDCDIVRLEEAFPGSNVVRRSEMNDRTSNLLNGRPHCQRHRAVNPTMLKILDIPFLMRETFLFCDSDILFFQRFSLQAYLQKAASHFVFMQDIKEAYSARIFHLAIKHRMRMPSRLNSGIMSIPPGRYDPDYVEWFLSVPDFCAFPQVVEQTIWGGMTGNQNVLFVDPKQVYCASPRTRISRDTVAVHFPSFYKSQMVEHAGPAQENAKVNGGNEAVALRLIKPARLGVRAMMVNGLRNQLGGW